MPWRAVEQRVKLYRDYKISTAIDDPMFAIAYYQGKAESYLRTVRDIGFTNIQIDTHFMQPDESNSTVDDDERRYFALAQELGLKIEGEVGQKWEEGDRTRAGQGRLNVQAIVAEAKRLLDAGCAYVYLERGTSMLWLKSLAHNDVRAAEKWWEEEYVIDPSLVKRSSLCGVILSIKISFIPDRKHWQENIYDVFGSRCIVHMTFQQAVQYRLEFWEKTLHSTAEKAARHMWSGFGAPIEELRCRPARLKTTAFAASIMAGSMMVRASALSNLPSPSLSPVKSELRAIL
jgi:hypothetical protein